MDGASIIWLLFVGGLAFLFAFMLQKMRTVRKMQKAQQEKYYETKEHYKNLTSEKFDETPIEELTHAVLFHIMGKEDSLFEGEEVDDRDVYDLLTDGEKLIYTIYQVELSMNGGRGSIHSFFIEEAYEKYRPYVEEAFTKVNCFEIAELMKSAARLAEIIELDLEDEENDITGEYENYNFSDYTQKLLSMLKSSGIVEKAGTFIQENKEQFIDHEETRGEEVDEERIESEI